jgi:glucosamine-phosphate N-acetyltransferase
MIEIRPCRPDDFEGILPLLRQLWPDKEMDAGALGKVFLEGIDSTVQDYICARSGVVIVGFCSLVVKNNLWQTGWLGHIDELVVDAPYRGQGIGTQLLEHIIKIARTRGCRRVELDSAFHRREAHQFYTENGFENRAYLFSKVL